MSEVGFGVLDFPVIFGVAYFYAFSGFITGQFSFGGF